MMRLVKMELYRLFHAISTFVMIVVAAGVAVLMSLALKVDLNEMEKAQEMQKAPMQDIGTESQVPAESFANGIADGFTGSGEESLEDGVTIGITSSADESWLDGDISAGDILMSEMNGGLLVIFIAIFVPLFVNAEQKRGYIKNIAGQIPRREMLAFSKLPAVAVLVFLLLFIFSIANWAASAVFFRGRLILGSVGTQLGVLGMQYVLHVSWGCLIALFTMATRSTAFAMTTGILLASGIADMLVGYLDRAIHAIIPAAERFELMRYTLMYATGAMTAESTMHEIGGFAVIAVIYMVVPAALAGIIYHKRDVR